MNKPSIKSLGATENFFAAVNEDWEAMIELADKETKLIYYTAYCDFLKTQLDIANYKAQPKTAQTIVLIIACVLVGFMTGLVVSFLLKL